jgi:hypothetical protein
MVINLLDVCSLFFPFMIEKDPYPVDALPTCDYALGVCKKESKCIQLLKDFRIHCKQSEDHQCKMGKRKEIINKTKKKSN